MFVPLPLIFNSIKLATMNNKRKDKDPLFAEVKLTGEEFRQSPSNYAQRTRFLKLVYPNDVTLIRKIRTFPL